MKRFAPVLAALAVVLTVGIVKVIGNLRPCLYRPDSVELIHFCFQNAERLAPLVNLAATLTRRADLQTLNRLVTAAGPFLGHEDFLLGLNQSQPTTYLVLLQNDTELRANGGFFGSYAVITAKDGKFDFRFQDTYVPDGQISGHVDPPTPIQEAFKQGWWKLRDSDWFPDFPSSAKTIRWFFTEGGETEPDFLLTLNLKLIEDMFRLTGPIEVSDYQLIVNHSNIYQTLQTQAEVGFFPGSTQKKDALTAIGRAFVNRLNQLDYQQKLAIAELILDQLEQQNLVVNTTDNDIQWILLDKNWAGQLAPVDCDSGCLSDTLAVIETNLGANKANCCIARLTTHTLSPQQDYLVHQLVLEYTNSSHEENPQPPDFYGGNYIQYLRFYLPKEAVFISITAEPSLPSTLLLYPQPLTSITPKLLTVGANFGFAEYGFFHTTRAGSSSKVSLSYSLPLKDQRRYQLNLLKQHGLTSSPQIIYWGTKQFQTELLNDYQLQVNLN